MQSGKKVNQKKLKSFVRAGIPEDIRGDAWIILTNSHQLFPTESYEGRRNKWMKRELLSKKLTRMDLRNIVTDVPRTMGNNVQG